MTQAELLDLLAQAKAEGWKELDLAGLDLEELPPEIGELTELESLVLGKRDPETYEFKVNRLTTLPSEIVQLSRLTLLDLRYNRLSSLPSEIVQLSQLTSLDLFDNQLSSLPSEIVQLSQLNELNLGHNKLSSLPSEIGQLSQLNELNLSFNNLSSLPSEIGQLSQLNELNLSFNKLSSLPSEIGQLSQLNELNLSFNQLNRVPTEIVQLSKLTELNLAKNQLGSVPAEIVQLSRLTMLSLSFNKLSSLPPEIKQLLQLTRLYLGGNQLSSLPPEIAQFSELTDLDLRTNQLSSLPEWIRDLPKLKELHLLGNPIAIPPEILTGDEWYEAGDLETILKFAFTPPSETQPLYETKLLIIGDGGAGKTTLANKLQNPDYQLQPEEKSTEGIDLIPWEIDHPSGNPLRTKIWDFGGQQIYHSTHQFFLTERSVYILVADTRKENTDFYYWLRVVETLSNGSPVIVVKNEKQNRQCDLDERSLRAEFLNLKEILAVNLADNRGLAELQNTLQNYLCHLPHVGMNVPIPWANIRAVLENLSQNQNFITQDRYFELCRNNGFDNEKDMLAASKFLHDLGICLHFQNVRGLRKLLILEPTWATGSIYKILDNTKIKADFGRFNDDDLESIWDEGDAAKMRDELLDLMMHFGLCYEIPNRRGHYISPQLLEKESLTYDWDDRDNLILRYEYTFKPKDIFPRFVVAVHEIIENQALVWRHGVVLTDGYARAEIIEEDRYHKAEIKIRVSGSNKRDLLSYVARELEKISNTYDRIDYETYIPCNCTTCKTSPKPHTYTWENLRRRLQNKRYDVECELSYAKVNVRSLLDDIAVPQAMSRDGDMDMDRFIDPAARSSPFSPNINVIYQQPQQTMTQNTGRTINTGGGDYRETHNSGNAQYAERDIINNHNTAKTPAESAQEIQDLLKQLDLTPDLANSRITTRIAKQDLDWQKRLWSALANAAPELLKSGAAIALAPLGFTGAAAAATLNVIVEATRGALEDEGEISPDEPDPIDMARLLDL